MTAALDLVDALAAWDVWCASTSKAGWRRYKGSQPPPKDRAIATRHVEAMVRLAEEVGVPHMVLRDRITAARRRGLTIEEAAFLAASP